MSVSKTWTSEPSNQKAVLERYRSMELPTIETIARELGATYHNVQAVLCRCMSKEEWKALSTLRYSASKTGAKNPMKGKTGEAHHNWKGLCDDGYGYLTHLWKGKRQFVHRTVMMGALGLEELPEKFAVHHIDGDPKNNELDNLAIVTHSGHKTIHYREAKDSLSLALKKSSLVEALKYLTSQ